MPEDTPTEPKPKPEEVKEPVVFPELPNGPAVFYNTDTDCIWYGIPFSKVNNPVIIMAAIDNAKLVVLNHLQQYQVKMLQREQFKQSALGQRTNGVIKDLFEKSKSLLHGRA